MEQLRAIGRSPKPSSNLNRRNFFDLAHGQSPGWQAISLSWGATCHCDVQRRWPVEIIQGSSRTRFQDRPETVRLHRGIGVHHHPGILFGFILE
jgi:hypothetical protein